MFQQCVAVADHVSASVPSTSGRNWLSAAYEVDNIKNQSSQKFEQSSPNSRSNCKVVVTGNLTSITGEAFDDISLSKEYIAETTALSFDQGQEPNYTMLRIFLYQSI